MGKKCHLNSINYSFTFTDRAAFYNVKWKLLQLTVIYQQNKNRNIPTCIVHLILSSGQERQEEEIAHLSLTMMKKYLSGGGSFLPKREVSVCSLVSMARAAGALRMRSCDAPADTLSSDSASAMKPAWWQRSV